MKNEIIKQAKEARKEIARIHKEEDTKKVQLENKRQKLHYQFQDKIYALRSAQSKSDRLYDDQKEVLHEEVKKKRDELSPFVEKLERILKLMEISKSEKPSLKLKVNNRDKEVILIDEPKADKYIRLYVYIYENKKPKNKFSLAIVGKHIFDREVLPRIDYPESRFEPYFENNSASFTINIKDAPTKEELMKFYEKSEASGLWTSGHYANLVKEYEFVLANCNTPEWEKEYLLSKKYYYKECYSNGVKTPEYKKIIRQLKAL